MMNISATVHRSLANVWSSSCTGIAPTLPNTIPSMMNASSVGTPILAEKLLSQMQVRITITMRTKRVLSYQNGNILVSQKKPSVKPITPIRMPTLAISLVSTRPVEEEMALGGVEIGKSIARDAHIAMKEIIA